MARPYKLIVYFCRSNVYLWSLVGRVITHDGVKNGMFDMLIMRKTEVIIRCGRDEVKGVISQYYPEFQLLKINNIMIPIGLIEQIEIMESDNWPSKPSHSQPRENRVLHLVTQAGASQ